MPSHETDLRALWTSQGVPQERQDELIAGIKAKAQPGARVGPFRIRFRPGNHVIWRGCEGVVEELHFGFLDGYATIRFPDGAMELPEAELALYHDELTPEGQQTVIPGCERDDERTGNRQPSLF